MNTNESSNKLLPVAVIVAGLFIAGAVIWNGSRPATPPADGGQDGTVTVDIANVKTEGNPYLGRADAPITIAFWSDFQCPFCKAVEVGGIPQITTPPALPEIIKNYVDTGKVKIVFKDVVFLSPRVGMDSLTDALYSQAVWKLYPKEYFVWRTAMFTAQDEEGGGFGNAASVDALNATIPGLDATKIAADVKANTDAYTQQANANTAEAQELGINATPSFIIGTQVIAGAYPYANFQTAIDALLK